MVTEQDAIDMEEAMRLLEQKREQQVQTQYNADIAIVEAWFNTLGINIQTATNRTQALDNFNQIKSLLETETDTFRIGMLRRKLEEANEKFKERKRNG